MTPSHQTLAARVAIVTGATAGIGLAIAADVAAAGARVVINGRRPDKLDTICADLNRDHPDKRVVSVVGDCVEQRIIDTLFDTARRAFAADADCIVINAGRGLSGSVVTSDPAQWEEMIRTNLLGAARLMRTAAQRLLGGPDPAAATLDARWTSRPRDIIAIGSVVGRHVSPFSSMYGSTKFGLHGLTEGLRRELAPKGIRVTLVEPGFVVSEFQGVAGYTDEWFKGVLDKIGPVLQPADVARVVRFVCEQPAAVHMSDILVRPTRQDYP